MPNIVEVASPKPYDKSTTIHPVIFSAQIQTQQSIAVYLLRSIREINKWSLYRYYL